MTSATDELRQMLDERGVEYFESPNGIAWGKLATLIHGRMYKHYAVELDGLLCVDSHCITPEQAIAVTLGGANVDDALALLDEMNEQGRIEYSDYSRLYDAIAATLGRGTCHDVWQDDTFANFKCSECDEELHYRDKKRIACCPFCKREVVRA